MPKANASAPAAKSWTEEMEAQLVEAYTGNEMNDQLGKLVEGKSAAAVRSKLVSLGVYEKNEPRKVGGASSTRKIEIVHAIETMLSKDRDSLASLEKASKAELDALSKAIIAISDNQEAESE